MEMQQEQQTEQSLCARMQERFYLLIFRRDVDFPEFLIGLVTMLLGLQLAAPWSSFAPFSPTFSVLASTWPHTEGGWGLLLAVAGATKIIAYLSGALWWRIVSSLLTSSLWAFISGAFGWANITGVGVILCVGTTISSIWVFWRLVFRLSV